MGSDMPMTTGHYLRSMKTLTNQWTPNNFRDERRQRLYLKDIDCPTEWHDALQRVIHPSLFYLNDNVSGKKQSGEDDDLRTDSLAAAAGDLMSSLPEEMRAQNLMCYIGHEGTYTPAHREMCASLGQNIMVEASDGTAPGEKEGSSVWFMTESKDREVVREYFMSMLGHDVEIEKHFAQVVAWKRAPFDVYVVDQRPGDFILIPPLAPHQVWNRGTRTMKVAWNRTTPETLELALHEALPKARLVCRDEQYKNKAIIYYTLLKYHQQLLQLEENAELTQMSFMGLGQDIVRNSPRAKQLAGDFKKLHALFTEILVDEMFAHKEKDVEFVPFDSCVTCSYCRSNIFNRFLTCKHCVRTLYTGDEDAYDVCMECYAMGRSCGCIAKLQWCEQWKWAELAENYETWRAMVIKNDGFVDSEHSPQPLEVARRRAGKKSLAQICQEDLKRRPFRDITKDPREATPSESEPDAAAMDDRPKKKKSTRKKKKGDVKRCHVCCHKDNTYKVHECTNPGCNEAYCYGTLYRAFDIMPQTVLADENWQCPKCLGICNCGACRRKGTTDPYTPKTTSLGHDTRAIADDRSVEALVDFGKHNLDWLRNTGEKARNKDTKRMRRLREQADDMKALDAIEQAEADGAMNTNGEHGNAYANNGYGDQSHIVNDNQNEQAPNVFPGHELEPLREALGDNENAGAVNHGGEHDAEQSNGVAENTLPENADDSMYPDPAVIARQRIGLGYYEADDAPDKILFDPYQAPTAEELQNDASEVPEFVQKSIRAAKRRARRENEEDPEYIVKSHHKKRRVAKDVDAAPAADPMDNMDPALFNEQISAPVAVMEETSAEGSSAQQRAIQDALADSEKPAHGPPRYDANEPELRHAKPLISYADMDENDIMAFDEDDIVTKKARPANTGDKSAADLAADAVAAIFGSPGTPKSENAINKDGNAPKRRGRPPKSVLEARRAAADAAPVKEPPAQVATQTTRRGRAVRSSLANITVIDDDEDEEETGRTAMPSSRGKRRGRPPGRPRRSGVTTIASASADYDDDEVETTSKSSATPDQPRRRGRPRKFEASSNANLPDEDDKPSVDPASTATSELPRRRGRPRKSEAEENATPDTRFMSMRERMALKGKKFKMGTRKSRRIDSIAGNTAASAEATPARQAEASPEPVGVEDETPATQEEDVGMEDAELPPSPDSEEYNSASSNPGSPSSKSMEPAPPPPLTAPSGRTVVRLGDHESDASTSSGPTDNSSESDEDDEDIPATRENAPTAT